MEYFVCVFGLLVGAIVILYLGCRIINLAEGYDDADLSINRTNKNGKGFVITFKGKRKLDNK